MKPFMPWQCGEVLDAEKPSHLFALFSGGHDSLCSTHMASHDPLFKGVVHCNTGIGIEQTREYVRQVCEDFGWPLYERHPDRFTYRDLLLGANGYHGFPGGPKSHMRFYYYLKERAIASIVRDFKTGPKDRIGLVTGLRKAESGRRMVGAFAEYAHRDGAQLWLNPILDWIEADKNAYMEEWNLPRNEVVDVLHRSGECLCGAFTSRGEFRMIEVFYPEVAARIKALESEVQAQGKCQEPGVEWTPELEPEPHYIPTGGCHWGRRGRENPDQLDFLPLCVGCEGLAA